MAIKTPAETIIDITVDPALNRAPKKEDKLIWGNTKKTDQLLLRSLKSAPYHWVRDKPDSRDYIYKSIPKAIPQSVDLRPLCTPIEDQGMLGSCTGQAIAGAIEYLNKKSGRPTDVSRLFIYYYERVILGTVNYDSGAYIRDGIKVVNKNGASLEKFWPYIISRYRTKPNSVSIQDAAKRKVLLYERAVDFDACINALANGYPITIGFDVYSSFLSRTTSTTGMMSYPNTATETLLGGHAVLLVGYNNSTNQFIARNSWGNRWGDRGYFYMPYQVIMNKTMSDDFWVIKTVNNPK